MKKDFTFIIFIILNTLITLYSSYVSDVYIEHGYSFALCISILNLVMLICFDIYYFVKWIKGLLK